MTPLLEQLGTRPPAAHVAGGAPPPTRESLRADIIAAGGRLRDARSARDEAEAQAAAEVESSARANDAVLAAASEEVEWVVAGWAAVERVAEALVAVLEVGKAEADALGQALNSGKMEGKQVTGRKISKDGKSGMIQFGDPNGEKELWTPKFVVNTRELEKLYTIDDNLYVIIDALMRDSRWDMKFLGMQIMIEGLATIAHSLEELRRLRNGEVISVEAPVLF